MKYTIPLSPEFLQELPKCADLQMGPDGDVYKCIVGVAVEGNGRIDVPVRLTKDSFGTIFVTLDL